MKSICIKTNNSETLQYLLNELNSLNLEQVCFSANQFRDYKNVIIHYTGDDNNLFLNKICYILSLLVIDEFENDLLTRILIQNYFYFDNNEKNQILNLCYDIMANDFSDIFNHKLEILFNCFYSFLISNKSLVLKGFINFRIKPYIEILEEIISEAVNNFIIEKEYLEFTSLLRLYINSQVTGCETVHIVYSSSDSILLDENKNIISLTQDIFKSKYLSDITFSSNDYILNALLTLIPKKIHIHLITPCIDDFINTLKCIFDKRVSICTDCNICKLYKNTLKIEDPSVII